MQTRINYTVLAKQAQLVNNIISEVQDKECRLATCVGAKNIDAVKNKIRQASCGSRCSYNQCLDLVYYLLSQGETIEYGMF